jgi:hypothetical protein
MGTPLVSPDLRGVARACGPPLGSRRRAPASVGVGRPERRGRQVPLNQGSQRPALQSLGGEIRIREHPSLSPHSDGSEEGYGQP